MGYLWGLSWARPSVIFTCLIPEIKYLIALENLQYLRYVDDILILAKDINEINIPQDTFQKNSILNFTPELNKNNQICFLDALIDTNNNNDNKFITPTYKKPSNNNSNTLNFKSERPFRYKKAIINNLVSRAKMISSSSSKTIFHKEMKKQTLINNGFPNYIVDEQIKRMIKNVSQQNKHCATPPSQQTYIKLLPQPNALQS